MPLAMTILACLVTIPCSFEYVLMPCVAQGIQQFEVTWFSLISNQYLEGRKRLGTEYNVFLVLQNSAIGILEDFWSFRNYSLFNRYSSISGKNYWVLQWTHYARWGSQWTAEQASWSNRVGDYSSRLTRTKLKVSRYFLTYLSTFPITNFQKSQIVLWI